MSITTLTRTERGYYITGGTLPRNAACYIVRRADTDLYQSLLRGEFCYILTARQMGKSSLMIRTAGRLREEGTAAVVVDLTARGQNLSPDQWYFGQLTSIGRQLDCEDEVEEFWYASARKNLSPLQRWQGALEHCVLSRCPGRIVVFIDEIDIVRSLGFETDEFFMAIREFYNRRAMEKEFERLTFCLIGVATPSGLIRDKSVTPFNIGRRVELTDFTPDEAAPLRAGLASGGRERVAERLLTRVLYWTGGHPFLTQTLCQAVAQDPSATDVRAVDRHCQALYLVRGARERDDNLLFVQDRMLRGDEDVAGVLTAYSRICSGKTVFETETPHAPTLRLSGICNTDGKGRLRVRNRIYAQVFDKEWVRRVMPDAEYRRQRAAYRSGVLRASLVAAAALAGIGVFGARAAVFETRAQTAEGVARAQLFATEIGFAQRAYDNNEIARAIELIKPYRNAPEYASRFEVGYLWGQFHQELNIIPAQAGVVAEAVSPDGRFLRRISGDGTVREYDARNDKPARTYALAVGKASSLSRIAASADGAYLAAWNLKGTVFFVRSSDGVCLGSVEAGTWDARYLAVSPDGKLCATGGTRDGAVTVWRNRGGNPVRLVLPGATRTGPFLAATALSFSPDGRTLVVGYADGPIRLWKPDAGKRLLDLPGHDDAVIGLAWDRGGKRFVSTGCDGMARVWTADATRPLLSLHHPNGVVTAAAFDPTGAAIATGALDRAVRVWDAGTGTLTATYRGHTEKIQRVNFLPSGGLLSGARDGTSRLWNAPPLRDSRPSAAPSGGAAKVVSAVGNEDGTQWVLEERAGKPYRVVTQTVRNGETIRRPLGGLRPSASVGIALTPDGTRAAIVRKNVVELWDTGTGRLLKELTADAPSAYQAVVFSPDGSRLAAAGWSPGETSGTVNVWDVRSGARSQSPRFSGGFSPMEVAFADQGRRVVLTGLHVTFGTAGMPHDEGRVTLLGLDDGTEQTVFQGGDVTGLALNQRAGLIAITHTDAVTGLKSLVLLALKDGSPVRTVRLGARPESVAFSPDGRTLVVAFQDEPMALFDVATGRETLVLNGRSSVGRPRFVRAGRGLAAVDNEGGLLVWNAD